MANGRTAIESKHYTQAESYFQNALKRRLNDKTAQTYLTQTQRYVSGENDLDARHFAAAQEHYQAVKETTGGSSILVTRATKQVKKVKLIRANYKQFKKILTKAQGQNKALNYGQSNTTLDELFNNATFREVYYKGLYDQALQLRKANNAGQSSAVTEASSSESSTSSSSDDSSSTATSHSSSASLTSSEQSAASAYSGSNEYTVTQSQQELNGKTITAAQINNARKTINAAGGQADAMSDQDVRVAIQQANKKDMSLTKYTAKYLK